MDAQGESDVLQTTLLPAPHQPNPVRPSPIPGYVPSSSLLRFQLVDIIRGVPLIEGNTWALVSKTWLRRFEKAATGQVDKEAGLKEDGLGPVDNSSLFEIDGSLNGGLVEGVDFECVPEEVWNWFTNLFVLPYH
jgi:ubiquitin carboxyl-terminal hydrolase 4/11